MTGGNRVVTIAIGPGSPEAVGEEFLLTEEVTSLPSEPEPEQSWDWEAEPETAPQPRNFAAIAAPVAASLAIAAWTGLYIWSQVASPLAPSSPGQWAIWIRDWSVPVMLIGVLSLLAMRTGRREAERFGAAARSLSVESALLETRLATVNGELSLAREFIAAQARDLESLGRLATERLSQSADRLAAIIQDNSRHIETIGTVSEAALDNMEKLRGQLPVIANSARDITSNIGNAGRTAHAQLQEMVNGFKRLNEFGQASERQVDTLRTLVSTTLAEFAAQSEDIAALSETRFAGLAEQGSQFRTEFYRIEAEALAASRQRIEELSGEIGQTREALDAHEAESIVSLRARLGALREECGTISRALRDNESRAIEDFSGKLKLFDEAVDQRRTRQEEQAGAIAAQGEGIAAQMAQLEAAIARIAEHSREAEAGLAGSVEALTGRLAASREALGETGSEIAGLTEASAHLLELIQASADHSREDIPKALSEAQGELEAVEARIAALRSAAEEAGSLGAQVHGHIAASTAMIAEATGQFEAMQGRITGQSGAHRETLDGLRDSLAEIEERSGRLAAHAQAELSSAIAQLSASATESIAGIDALSDLAIAAIAQKLGEQSKEAVAKALDAQLTEAAGSLELASSRASDASREAAIQLRDQLAMVNELAGNLESRVTQARERAEEQVDNDFSRRAALITESLNSNAIDIARALATDVTDTSWASYLKGDRGIFTRRAVKLLESGEAKPILQLYESDRDFHEHVSRFIHDFEALLRQVLSTRDGNAMGVTLLSSDMGKLYVTLAQAIERLRS